MRALLDEYSAWKARRTEIPLDWNPRAKAFEPDYKLKKLERFGRYSAWALWGGLGMAGILVVNSY